MQEKDADFGIKNFKYELDKEAECLSKETLLMLTNKYKMNFVKPTKPYLIKLQKFKDQTAY
jgi:hypothetical protein